MRTAGVGYTVLSVASLAPHGDGSLGWIPINDLAVENADIDLVFIAPNAIRFQAPVDDPVFGAHYEIQLSGGGTYYEADGKPLGHWFTHTMLCWVML